VADGSLQCIQSNWLCATFADSRPMLVFCIFVRVFPGESLGRKSFRFLQVSIKILALELKVFPHSISLRYCYARHNSMNEHCSVTHLGCYQSIK